MRSTEITAFGRSPGPLDFDPSGSGPTDKRSDQRFLRSFLN
jgi:hypothetical protein